MLFLKSCSFNSVAMDNLCSEAGGAEEEDISVPDFHFDFDSIV